MEKNICYYLFNICIVGWTKYIVGAGRICCQTLFWRPKQTNFFDNIKYWTSSYLLYNFLNPYRNPVYK